MTRYEEFKQNAKANIEAYREQIKGNGGFEFIQQITQLSRLQAKMNSQMLIYLFGEQLGNHYAEKFVKSNRCLLRLMDGMDGEAKFFLLHELKTNENLFVYC